MPDKKINFKDGGPGSKIGNFLRSIDKEDLLNAGSVATNIVSGNWLGAVGAIKQLVKKDATISEADKIEAYKIIELEYADLANARDMQVQIATSEHSTKLGKNFIYYLATGTFIFSSSMVVMLFFVDIPENNRDVINFILGIIVGTGLVGIFQYFFGSSKGSSDKGDELRNLLNNKK